jgi:uncharacterized glyoxalase superfamily protein PhnB
MGKDTVVAVELNPYLFFPGNTEQAIAFCQQVFGGQVTITRRGDVDPTATAGERKSGGQRPAHRR